MLQEAFIPDHAFLRIRFVTLGNLKPRFISATADSHLVQDISRRVGPSTAKPPSMSTTTWQQSFTGNAWSKMPAALSYSSSLGHEDQGGLLRLNASTLHTNCLP